MKFLALVIPLLFIALFLFALVKKVKLLSIWERKYQFHSNPGITG